MSTKSNSTSTKSDAESGPSKDQMPFDAIAEERALQSILYIPTQSAELISRLTSDHFYDPQHRLLFQTCKAIIEEGVEGLSELSLRTAIASRQLSVDTGTLAVVCNKPDVPEEVSQIIEVLHRKRTLRDVASVCYAAAREALITDDPKSLIQSLDDVSARFIQSDKASTYKSLPQLTRDAIDRMQEASEDEDDGMKLETGFEVYDQATRGLKPTELMVIAARPGMGKTTLALNVVWNILRAEPRKNIVFYSLEMVSGQIIDRLIAIATGVSLKKMQSGNLSQQDISMIGQTVKTLAKMKKSGVDDGNLTIASLTSNIRSRSIDGPIDLVVIDYLQLIGGKSSRGSRYDHVSGISSALKRLANEYGFPIIAICQLNRDPEKRQKGIPRLSDLRESGQIEQDADTVAFLYDPEQPDEKMNDKTKLDFKVIIAKNRHGETGEFSITWSKPCYQMQDQ